MMTLIKNIWRCLANATVNTINHDGIEHAGYLAFLWLLSMFPFLVFAFAIIGFMGQGETGARFITEILMTLPAHVAEALQPRVNEIISGPPQGLLTISILGAIWTSSSAVEGLRTILNRAYHVTTPPAYWFRRSLSVLQLLIFTFILIVGMLLVVTLPLVLQNVGSWLHITYVSFDQDHWSRVVYLGTVGALFIAVCYIYYTIPNIKQTLVGVAPGAGVVVILWIWSANLFTAYLANFDQVNLIYGSLGGLIAALIFFYICNVIFIFGAELNYQIVHLLGKRVVQKEATEETSVR